MGYQTKSRRARVRLIALGAFIVALVAGGGMAALTATPDGEGTSARPEGKSPRNSPGQTPTDRESLTPASAPPTKVIKPKDSKNGIGVGFPHTSVGAQSAAVGYLQDLDVIDDQVAKRQLTTIASDPSDPAIQTGVSDVRKLREGVGLPPSGGAPGGLTFTTTVKATLLRSLDDEGDVLQVWMVYDRYATSEKKSTDDQPLKDQVTNMIVTWQDGDWKLTEDPKWTKKTKGPRSYEPNSTWAFQDGWRQVADE